MEINELLIKKLDAQFTYFKQTKNPITEDEYNKLKTLIEMNKGRSYYLLLAVLLHINKCTWKELDEKISEEFKDVYIFIDVDHMLAASFIRLLRNQLIKPIEKSFFDCKSEEAIFMRSYADWFKYKEGRYYYTKGYKFSKDGGYTTTNNIGEMYNGFSHVIMGFPFLAPVYSDTIFVKNSLSGHYIVTNNKKEISYLYELYAKFDEENNPLKTFNEVLYEINDGEIYLSVNEDIPSVKITKYENGEIDISDGKLSCDRAVLSDKLRFKSLNREECFDIYNSNSKNYEKISWVKFNILKN